ncbi:TPA: hypothetical protein ACKPYZ_000932 [Stenotrophomonas maltophilia]
MAGATEKDLANLRNEYLDLALRCRTEAKKLRGDRAAALEGQARAYAGCAADLFDLINGRKHPSARRR